MENELVRPRCQGTHGIHNGSSRGHRRFKCQDGGRTLAGTVGTPLFHLPTPLLEIVCAIMVVPRRGSLRAAEEQTGHNDETIAEWIRRIGAHAERVTDVLVHDLDLSEVELDEVLVLRRQKGGAGAQVGPADAPGEETGERWGALSQDRASRFIVAWTSGPRVETLAPTIVTTTRPRTSMCHYCQEGEEMC